MIISLDQSISPTINGEHQQTTHWKRLRMLGAVYFLCSRYHLAFVFNVATLNREIYLNGQLISGQIVTSVYLGTSGNTTIGRSGGVSTSNLFPGKQMQWVFADECIS